MSCSQGQPERSQIRCGWWTIQEREREKEKREREKKERERERERLLKDVYLTGRRQVFAVTETNES
jgi:hypothetical protein